jgi:putative ABC transport system permease protein
MRPVASLANLRCDLSYGFRMLRKNPGFTVVAVLTLALGIGANTAMFSVVDSILLRALPYKDSERLVVVWEKPPKGMRNSVSAANFLDWREQNNVFENLVAISPSSFNLSGKDKPERLTGMSTSWDFFKLLGVQPALGRSFSASDDVAGAPRVAVISHALWQRKLASDPDIVGRSLTVDGSPCTIIGVMPREFQFFYSPEIWMPLALDRAQIARDFHYLIPLGKLKSGVSLPQAQAEMDAIARNIEQAHPKSNKGWGVFVELVQEAIVAGQRQIFWVLFGAVGFVLLIACVNVANLLLAKAAVRQSELAVRASLGAGRLRLVAQLLTESVLLAIFGGALGLLLAFWLVKILHALIPPARLAGFAEISIDWRVLVFTLALSIFTGLLFGLVPAWRVTRFNLNELLKEGWRGSTSSSRHARFQGLLVVGETALSLVLLVCAGLMIRSMMAMQDVDPGFRPDHVLTMRLSMPDARYRGAQAVRMFYRQVLEQAGSIPGVKNTSISLTLPLQGSSLGMPFQIASHPQVPVSEAPGAPYKLVSHGYFATMGISLKKGRFFNERDNENGPPVSIVNETFVKQYLPEEEPLGQRIVVEELITGKRELGPPIPWEIVGVIKDVKFGGLNSSGVPVIYVPMLQSPWPGGVLGLRTAVEPMSVAKTVQGMLAKLDPDMPVTGIQTMEQVVIDSMTQARVQIWFFGSFAAVALALASLGIYGVMSYTVAQGTHDIGLRIALGASEGKVLKLVLGKGMMLTGFGLLVGIGGSLALTRLISSMLFGIKPTDLWTYAAVSLLLAIVALIAGYIPARRAAEIDPLIALRSE